MERKHQMTAVMIEHFIKALSAEEKSRATIEKYSRDLKAFFRFICTCQEKGKLSVEKMDVIAYKEHLAKKYAVASANSMLAGINSFFKHRGWLDCVVKPFRKQNWSICLDEREMTREDYVKLLKAAKIKSERIYLCIQSICSTGIRVSELRYITLEAAMAGCTEVRNKGKIRTIVLPEKLCRKLIHYAKKCAIHTGCIFVTRTGQPLDRSNIWREMKGLSSQAGVLAKKVFPHNLRHLFAHIHYRAHKDLIKLADLLGHSDINTTRIYMHSTLGQQKLQISALKLVL